MHVIYYPITTYRNILTVSNNNSYETVAHGYFIAATFTIFSLFWHFYKGKGHLHFQNRKCTVLYCTARSACYFSGTTALSRKSAEMQKDRYQCFKHFISFAFPSPPNTAEPNSQEKTSLSFSRSQKPLAREVLRSFSNPLFDLVHQITVISKKRYVEQTSRNLEGSEQVCK